MISVIVPVYNSEDYLHICLNSILKQTYHDFEVICIDDASTDSSLEIVEYFIKKDSRFKLIKNDVSKGKNSSMNSGLGIAQGEYVTFLDDYEWFDENALEMLVEASKKDDLDLLLFNVIGYNQKGDLDFNKSNMEFMDGYNQKVFGAEDLEEVMRRVIINAPLKRFYSKSFLDKNNFVFPKKNSLVESISVNKLFSSAKNISFLDKFLIVSNERIVLENNNIEKLSMILNGIIDDYFPVISLNHSNVDKLGPSLMLNMIGNFEDFLHKQNIYNYFNQAFSLFKLSKIRECFKSEDMCSKEFYQSVRQDFIKMRLNSEILNALPFELYTFYINVLNYEEMEKLFKFTYDVKKRFKYINKKSLISEINEFKEIGINTTKRNESIIVSLTSFPERMFDIHFCLYSLLKQTFKPDKVILWLGIEKFPNKEKDLPESVLKLKENGLTIKWCEDIRSYTKLIPALKEFPDDFIVTADDDVFYPSDWLENMLEAYKKHPKTIISSRLRKIKLDSNNQFEKYGEWDFGEESSNPSFLNFPTGVGGVMYFPNALSDIVFKEEIFRNVCPDNDDMWFWMMAVLNGTKIAGVSKPFISLNYINIVRQRAADNSFTLWNLNKEGQNDEQFKSLTNYFPEVLEIITKK